MELFSHLETGFDKYAVSWGAYLKKRRKEVEQLKEQQNLQMIYERIQASGKTIDEVLSYLAE